MGLAVILQCSLLAEVCTEISGPLLGKGFAMNYLQEAGMKKEAGPTSGPKQEGEERQGGGDLLRQTPALVIASNHIIQPCLQTDPTPS